jgi:predicted nucleotidyltransferase
MPNSFGIQPDDLKIIISAITQYPEVSEALIFGSRAKGIFRNGSDVDIALKGEGLNADIVSRISYLLNEETTLPYKFDVLNYHTISNKELVDHIDRVGIRFYLKEKQ